VIFKTLSIVCVILASFVLCSTAAGQDVKYWSLAGTDFSTYKTYKWEHAEKATYDGLVEQIVRRTVDAELAKKGLSRTESDEADLYIVYQLATSEDMTWSSFTAGTAWYGGVSGFPGSIGATTNSSYVIRRGQLNIDMYDVKQKTRVWEVEATKTLKDKFVLEKMEGNIQKVITKIFKKYPPGK
jgi:Domain of unknown function (DUF4136)